MWISKYFPQAAKNPDPRVVDIGAISDRLTRFCGYFRCESRVYAPISTTRGSGLHRRSSGNVGIVVSKLQHGSHRVLPIIAVAAAGSGARSTPAGPHRVPPAGRTDHPH